MQTKRKTIINWCLIALLALSACAPKSDTLIVLHTNDTHSQVESLSATSKYGNRGGYARRYALVTRQRAEAQNVPVLLLDAGDFCQGTPYFNLYHGRVEVEAMNYCGYDAATLGNHEFDNGLDTLAMLLRMAKFPVVCANYQVEGTSLEGLVKPYVILKRGGLRIGIFGLGVDPQSLIAQKNFGNIRFLNPIETAMSMADKLRAQRCDVVICLSHLGYENSETGVSDENVAAATTGIDAIVGGHTHKLVNAKVANAQGDSVQIGQMLKSGVYVGKMTLHLAQ